MCFRQQFEKDYMGRTSPRYPVSTIVRAQARVLNEMLKKVKISKLPSEKLTKLFSEERM